MQMSNKNLLNFIGKLPDEIKNIIISYTYNIQNSDLLQDIKSYIKTKDIISTIYYNKNKHLLKYEYKADKYWLFSDILHYIKTFYLINYRCNLLIERKFLLSVSKHSIEHRLNKLWMLLTPNQRDIFIQIRTPKNKNK
jgi:hypothetical protein